MAKPYALCGLRVNERPCPAPKLYVSILRFIPRKLLHKPTVFTVLTDQAGNAIQTLPSSPWQKWFAHSAASGMEVSLRTAGGLGYRNQCAFPCCANQNRDPEPQKRPGTHPPIALADLAACPCPATAASLATN